MDGGGIITDLADPEKTIFFAGGGTGGHLFPGIAVAQALTRRDPSVRPVFLCTNRAIDKTILDPTGFEYVVQPIVPPTRSIGGLLKFWRAWRETKDLVKSERRKRNPVAVLGLGGYAAGVAVKVCASRKVPAALLNPDVIPGKANRYLMQFAQVICCQFDQTAQHTPSAHRSKLRTTGCPIRPDLSPLPKREEAIARLNLDPALRTLLITGASQGARTVNEAVLESLKEIKLQGWQIIHLAGTDHADSVRQEYRDINLAAHVIDFTNQMRDIWAAADLCISRSGASTCAELTAAAVPSILMPYPFHKDMHQRVNAKVLADAGAAELLDDEKDRRKNAAKLKPLLEKLLYDSTARYHMHEKAKALSKPNAAELVADELLKLIAPPST